MFRYIDNIPIFRIFFWLWSKGFHHSIIGLLCYLFCLLALLVYHTGIEMQVQYFCFIILYYQNYGSWFANWILVKMRSLSVLQAVQEGLPWNQQTISWLQISHTSQNGHISYTVINRQFIMYTFCKLSWH